MHTITRRSSALLLSAPSLILIERPPRMAAISMSKRTDCSMNSQTRAAGAARTKAPQCKTHLHRDWLPSCDVSLYRPNPTISRYEQNTSKNEKNNNNIQHRSSSVFRRRLNLVPILPECDCFSSAFSIVLSHFCRSTHIVPCCSGADTIPMEILMRWYLLWAYVIRLKCYRFCGVCIFISNKFIFFI